VLLPLVLAATVAAATPTPTEGAFAGVTSEVGAVAFDVTRGGRRVRELHFVNQCFADRAEGIDVPASIPIRSTYRPKRRKGSKHRPKPRPLRQPTFSFTGAGFTIHAKFTSPAHAEGTLRWVPRGGCDTGRLGFGADVVVQPG
jgi:hypothetical protein